MGTTHFRDSLVVSPCSDMEGIGGETLSHLTLQALFLLQSGGRT
jgi:hypothetical protein